MKASLPKDRTQRAHREFTMHRDDHHSAFFVPKLDVAATLAHVREARTLERRDHLATRDRSAGTHTATSTGTMMGDSAISSPASSSKYSSKASTRLTRASSSDSP